MDVSGRQVPPYVMPCSWTRLIRSRINHNVRPLIDIRKRPTPRRLNWNPNTNTWIESIDWVLFQTISRTSHYGASRIFFFFWPPSRAWRTSVRMIVDDNRRAFRWCSPSTARRARHRSSRSITPRHGPSTSGTTDISPSVILRCHPLSPSLFLRLDVIASKQYSWFPLCRAAFPF